MAGDRSKAQSLVITDPIPSAIPDFHVAQKGPEAVYVYVHVHVHVYIYFFI